MSVAQVSEYTEVIVQGARTVTSPSPQERKTGSIANRALLGLIQLLLLFLPLVFLPLTSEYYETTKQAFLVAVIPLAFLCLVSISIRRRHVVGTTLDKVLLAILAASTLSALFSVNLYTSIFGHYGRFHGGIINLVLYASLYYLIINAVSSFGQIKKIVRVMVFAAVLLALLGVLQRFEIYLLPFGYARFHSWTPLGSPTAAGYLTAFMLPLSLIMAATGGVWKSLFYLGFLVQLLFLGLTGNWLAWLVAVVGLIALVGLARNDLINLVGRAKVLVIIVFTLAAAGLSLPLLATHFLPAGLTTAPVEVTLPPGISVQIVWKTLLGRPFIGQGPETFIYSYSRFKPWVLNRTPFWNFRFDRPFNEIFYFLATIGLLGTGLYLWFWYRAGRIGLAAKSQVRDYPPADRLLVAGLVATLWAFITHLFVYYTTTTSAVYFWAVLAMIVVVGEREIRSIGKTAVSAAGLRLGSIVLVGLVYFFYFGRYYRAHLHYGAALRAFADQKGAAARDHLLRSISLNADLDVYHTSLSTVDLALARALTQGEKPDQATITALIQQGINEAQKARRLNQANGQNWEHLAGYYRSLSNIANGAESWVLTGFTNAIRLDPLNPRLRENLASFYADRGRVQEAESAYQLAIKLKPDYVLAHYNLSRLYRSQERFEDARKELRRVLALLPEEEPARGSIESQLEDLDKLALKEADAVARQIEAQSAKESLPSLQLDPEPPIATPSGERRTFLPTPPPEVPQPPLPSE